MDIRILKSNRPLYRVDSTLAIALIDSGLAEQIVPPPPAPVKPDVSRFGITKLPYSGCFTVQRIRGAETAYFDGWPHQLKNSWPDCPDDIEREYTRTFEYRSEVHGAASTPAHSAAVEAHRKKVLG